MECVFIDSGSSYGNYKPWKSYWSMFEYFQSKGAAKVLFPRRLGATRRWSLSTKYISGWAPLYKCKKGLVLSRVHEMFVWALTCSRTFKTNETKYCQILLDMGPPISKEVQLVSFHTVSKGYWGECGQRGGYFEMTNIPPQVTYFNCPSFSYIS